MPSNSTEKDSCVRRRRELNPHVPETLLSEAPIVPTAFPGPFVPSVTNLVGFGIREGDAMARQRLPSEAVQARLLGLPVDEREMIRHAAFGSEDFTRFCIDARLSTSSRSRAGGR